MRFIPIFQFRNFTTRLVKPDVEWEVSSYSHRAIGGPHQATIRTTRGTDTSLWELLEYLRCPVVIYDEIGRPCWWGAVYEVKIHSDGITYGASLEQMANRLYAYWTTIGGGGERHNTAVVEDATSIAEYGRKSEALSIEVANATMADYFRDAALARRKYPIPTVAIEAGEDRAELHCRGWWDFLAWRKYIKSTSASVVTTTQIYNIITDTFITGVTNAFYTAVDIETASGISTSEYRDGDQTCKAEIETLLKAGTTNNRRLLATVDVNRRVRIYEEPVQSISDNTLTRAGDVQTNLGIQIPAHLVTAGQWLTLRDVIPASADTYALADPSRTFIEQVTWSPSGMRFTARDVPDVYDMFRVRQDT